MNKIELIPLNESKSLVWLRAIAMLSIVTCHVFQAYNIPIWGCIFNVGVQIFFVLSGYLYGYKTIDNWKSWHLKRINKIYIPYLVFLICVVPLYALFHNEAMNWKALPFYFANLQGFRFIKGGSFARIEGLRHVWFLTAIMCDYLITFVLQRIRNKSNIVIPALIALIVVAYLILPLRIVFIFSWIYLYALGYFYVNLDDKWKKFYNVLIILGFVTMICLVSGSDFNRPFSVHYRLIHDLGGLFGIIIGVKVLSLWNNIKVPSIIAFFDKWSFHVYIVHFIIMCGPFSMAYITPYFWLNIGIMLVVTAAFTYVFVQLLNFLNKKIHFSWFATD